MRAAITSEWSPKIERPCVAIARAATWITAGVSSPAILNMFGSISSSPCDDVNVVASEPGLQRPVDGPGRAALALHLDDRGTAPQTLRTPCADHVSESSPIGEAGVIG